jgi:iron complex outermembrane receptor protein
MRRLVASALALAAYSFIAPAGAQTTENAPQEEAHPAPESGSPLEEIVITASGHERTRFDVIQSTNVLTGDDLKREVRTTLGDTLANQPGIASTGFTAGASRPVIRGLDGPRVRVLQNGVSTGDVSNVSADHQVTSQPLLVDRIEVLRGAGTLRYGSNAIGGVVNVIDGSIPSELPQGVEGAGDFGYDFNADAVNGALAARTALGSFAVYADGSFQHAHDFEIPGSSWTKAERASSGPGFGSDAVGFAPNTSLRAASGRLGVSRIFEEGFLGASYTRVDSRYGVPVGEDGEPIDIDLHQNRYDGAGELRHEIGPFERASFRFTHSDYQHTELEGETPGTKFLNDENELRVELSQRAWHELDGVVGFQWHGKSFQAIGAEALVPPGHLRQYGLFGVEEWHGDPLSLEGGIRLEQTDVDAQGLRSRSFTTASVSLGASVTPIENLLVGVTLSRTERPPTPEELYSNGAHGASFSFEVGDPSLGPEVAYGAELTMHVKSERLTGSATFFYTYFRDFIFARDTGNVVDEFPERVYTATNAHFYGAELEAHAPLAEFGSARLSLDGSLDYTRAQRSSGDDLPRIPPLRVRATLALVSMHEDAYLGVEWAARQARVASFERPTDDYFFVNAGAAWRPLERIPGLSLRLDLRNLADAKGRNAVSFLKELAPLPGRSARVSVAVDF